MKKRTLILQKPKRRVIIDDDYENDSDEHEIDLFTEPRSKRQKQIIQQPHNTTIRSFHSLSECLFHDTDNEDDDELLSDVGQNKTIIREPDTQTNSKSNIQQDHVAHKPVRCNASPQNRSIVRRPNETNNISREEQEFAEYLKQRRMSHQQEESSKQISVPVATTVAREHCEQRTSTTTDEYIFHEEDLHKIKALSFMDPRFNESSNRARAPWEKAWSSFATTLESKYEYDPAMIQADVKNITENWIPFLEEMKSKIIERVVNQVIHSWKGFSSYDIRIDDRKWNVLTDVIRKITRVLQRDERRTDPNLHILISLKKRADLRKENERKQAEIDAQEWNNLKQKPDRFQLQYFVSKFGPSEGRKQFSEWKGCITLCKGVSFVAEGLDAMKQLHGPDKSNIDQVIDDSSEAIPTVEQTN